MAEHLRFDLVQVANGWILSDVSTRVPGQEYAAVLTTRTWVLKTPEELPELLNGVLNAQDATE